MITARVRNAERMMIAITPAEEGVQATFADGCSGTIPFVDLPEIGCMPRISAVELPNPYEVILTTTQDEIVELPWDFVRHYCDPNYQPRMELVAALERHDLGSRVRELRETAGLTQEALAQFAGVARITLVRLENGKHTPKLATLKSVAAVLGRTVEDLLTGPEAPEVSNPA